VMIQNDKSMVIVSRNAKNGDENFVGCFIASFVKWEVIEMRHSEFLSLHISPLTPTSPSLNTGGQRRALGHGLFCSPCPLTSACLV